ncbi:MAG: DnaB-like helicase C-terminal domain-containing protein, partial [Aeromicrobium sp.]
MVRVDVTRGVSTDHVLDAAQLYLEQRRAWREVRHAYQELDEVIGPLLPGQLTTVTGERGVGRTTFALDLCRAVALQQGRSCLLVTGLSAADLGVRLLAAEARVSHGPLRTGDLYQQDIERLAEAHVALRAARLVMLDHPGDTGTLQRDAYEAWLVHDVDLVIVDDADRLFPSPHGDVTVLASLGRLARQMQVPVLATGTLLRERSNTDEPQMRELWGPPGEQSVSTSIALYRP